MTNRSRRCRRDDGGTTLELLILAPVILALIALLVAAGRTSIAQGAVQAAARDAIFGGRIYDAHIAEIARACASTVVVTDNRRHFLSALRYGIRVETPAEFVQALKRKR